MEKLITAEEARGKFAEAMASDQELIKKVNDAVEKAIANHQCGAVVRTKTAAESNYLFHALVNAGYKVKYYDGTEGCLFTW